MLDSGPDELVDREERVGADPDHVAELFLKSRGVDVVVEELLRQVEQMLVVVLRCVAFPIDCRNRSR